MARNSLGGRVEEGYTIYILPHISKRINWLLLFRVVLRRIQRVYEDSVRKSDILNKQHLSLSVWVLGFRIAPVGERKGLWDMMLYGAAPLGSAQSGKLQLL